MSKPPQDLNSILSLLLPQQQQQSSGAPSPTIERITPEVIIQLGEDLKRPGVLKRVKAMIKQQNQLERELWDNYQGFLQKSTRGRKEYEKSLLKQWNEVLKSQQKELAGMLRCFRVTASAEVIKTQLAIAQLLPNVEDA
jgi:hypothetical protein